jgi:hypothetical protein
MADDKEAARLALHRAHRAAADLDGGELRRALEEAHELLAAGSAEAGVTDKVVRALALLETGPLDEAERLVEEARTELGEA